MVSFWPLPLLQIRDQLHKSADELNASHTQPSMGGNETLTAWDGNKQEIWQHLQTNLNILVTYPAKENVSFFNDAG